jgi:hypothetical protein
LSRLFATLAIVIFTLTACGGSTVNRGTISDASAGAGAADGSSGSKPPAETPTWGKRYTWPGGLAVEIAPPKPCKPGEFAVSTTKDIQRAVKVSITVVNGSGKPFDTGVLSFGSDAQFNGRKAEQIYDSSGECGGGPDSTTVLPGKAFTTDVAYAVGPQPGELQLAVQPSFGADKAIFVGQA